MILFTCIFLSRAFASEEVVELYKKAKLYNYFHSFDKDNFNIQVSGTSSMFAKTDDSQRNIIDDFYYIKLDLVISPKKTKNSHYPEDDVYNSILEIFDVSIRPKNNTPTQTSVIQSSPATSKSSTSISSSVGWSFGSNLGFFGKDVGTGGASVSYSINNSVSYNIEDISIENRTIGNTAGWRFEIVPGSLLSKYTFQPTVQALWHFSPETRKNLKDNNNSMIFDISFTCGGELITDSVFEVLAKDKEQAIGNRLSRHKTAEFNEALDIEKFMEKQGVFSAKYEGADFSVHVSCPEVKILMWVQYNGQFMR